MARLLRCAVEQFVDWHPHLFVEAHAVAFVALASRYSRSPAYFDVECENVASRWLGNDLAFRLGVSWHDDTAEKAERLRATIQPGPLVELATVALALILCKRVVPFGRMDVTEFGARADFRSRKHKLVLEVSGTELPAEFGRRHRAKVAQARNNPFGWAAYVLVCAYAATGHRIRFSQHPSLEK
ncbi:MAG: hypothetical protein JNM56_17065 [Planctomycetia bacterium]|nr:hypothetical protein [Planctomycetia bacterium]